ncbi:MAG: hypothetical protein EBX03_14800, partial [Rhodobacteraceae bacterium]|nr:hypothetical protein [Paracoccaceae bacterium]
MLKINLFYLIEFVSQFDLQKFLFLSLLIFDSQKFLVLFGYKKLSLFKPFVGSIIPQVILGIFILKIFWKIKFRVFNDNIIAARGEKIFRSTSGSTAWTEI